MNLGYRALAALILLCGVLRAGIYEALAGDLPSFAKPHKVLWLDQGWDSRSASWFHHADQGTETFAIPYEWFIALEQLRVSIKPSGPFKDLDYLDRFGFIPDDDPASLPIGFAHGGPMRDAQGAPWTNPATGQPMTSIGLTCAACHTGRLTYNGTEIRVDGAPANTNLKLFQEHLGMSLFETLVLPLRRHRFEDRVLGPGASLRARLALVSQLNDVLLRLNHVKKLEGQVASQSVDEGYGRLDALNRIGNTVFSLDLGLDANYAPESAPVHFPRIWDDSWFLWVQYDGSIEQPMVRNAGEALGVSAPVQLTGPTEALFQSGVHVNVLDAMEQMLAGKPPSAAGGFTGLRSPRWDDPKLRGVLPPIDVTLASRGQQLYADRCQGCHLAPVGIQAFWSSSRWIEPSQACLAAPAGTQTDQSSAPSSPANSVSQRYLDLKLIPIADIGTDSSQATGLASRKVGLPSALGIPETAFGPALGDLVEKVVNKWYDSQRPPTSPDDRERMNGNRPNCIQAHLAYKARPLDGIWATPPYLHNGSVPSLYDLLSPVSERPKLFFLGNREYDPVKVGLRTEKADGLTALDTSRLGNLATGHEFSNTPGPGVIGRYLEPDERRALIEYLKTL